MAAEIEADERKLRLEALVDGAPLPVFGSGSRSDLVSLFGPKPAAWTALGGRGRETSAPESLARTDPEARERAV